MLERRDGNDRLGQAASDIRKAWRQPELSQSRQCSDAHLTIERHGTQFLNSFAEAVEGGNEDGCNRGTGGSQPHALRTPLEQVGPGPFLQRLDMLCDRAGRHPQFVRGSGKTAKPRRRFEGPQRVERRTFGSWG